MSVEPVRKPQQPVPTDVPATQAAALPAGPKAQRGKGELATPPLPPVDFATIRENAGKLADANARCFDALAVAIDKAVTRDSVVASVPGLDATFPVVVTLQPASKSLRGCVPSDPDARTALNRYMKMLPLHISVEPARFFERLKERLQSLAGADTTVLDVRIAGVKHGVYDVLVHRVPNAMVDALSEGNEQAVAALLARIAGPPRGEVDMEALVRMVPAGDQATVYGVLRYIAETGAAKSWKFEPQYGLSHADVTALTTNGTLTTRFSPAVIVAQVLRYGATLKADADNRRACIAASPAMLAALRDAHLARHPDVATAQEKSRLIVYPVPAIFESAFSAFSPLQRNQAMGAIIARMRSNWDESDSRFTSNIGVTRARLLRLMSGDDRVSAIPVATIVNALLNVTGSLRETWWTYTNVDEDTLRALRSVLSDASRTRDVGDELRSAPSFTLSGEDLLDALPRREQPVLNECMNAIVKNLYGTENSFMSTFKIARKDFEAMLGGGTVSSRMKASKLAETILDFMADAPVKGDDWARFMTCSRHDVARALDRLRGA